MKQPRVNDFDPNANEHKLNSPMDSFPVIEKAPQEPPQMAVPRTIVPPILPVPPRRKIKQRHPFDIYEDQLEELKRLSLEDRLQGGVGSMSAMVRAGIDLVIAQKRRR